MQKALWLSSDFALALDAAGLNNAVRISALAGGELRTQRQCGWLIRDTVPGIGTVYIKWYGAARPSVVNRVIGSQAYREWTSSLRMSELGIPQPEILAAGTRYRLCSVTGSYLVTREIPAVTSLQSWLEDSTQTHHAQTMRELAADLVAMIEKMHHGQFCHWDLKLRNILIRQQSSGRFQLIPIDATNGRRIAPWNRGHCRERDYRFLLRNSTLAPYITTARKADAQTAQHSHVVSAPASLS